MACFKVCLTTDPCAVWLSESNFLQIFLHSCWSTVAISMTKNTVVLRSTFLHLSDIFPVYIPTFMWEMKVSANKLLTEIEKRCTSLLNQWVGITKKRFKKMEGFKKYWHGLCPPTTVQHDNAISIKDSLSSLVIGEGEQTFPQLSLSLPACPPPHNTWSAVIIHCWPISWQVCNGM